MPPQTRPTESKLRGDLARALPHLDLDPQGKVLLERCHTPQEALASLSRPAFDRGDALVAHALPAREAAVACACHGTPPPGPTAVEGKVRDRPRNGSANRPTTIAVRR
jgi:hypothetical protein